MKNTILKTFGAVSSLAIVLAVSGARADILLTNMQTVAIPPSDPATYVEFTIAQFNLAGTLQSVQLTVSGSASASLIYTNMSAGNTGVDLQESNTFSIAYNNSSALVSNTFFFQTAGFPSYVYPVGPGQGYDTNWSQSVGPVTVNYTSPGDLANFTGAGDIPVTSGFDDYFSGGASGGNNVFKVMTTGSATAQVIYDYTVIPEPSTCGLLLLGLGSLLAAARHKKP